MPKRRPTEARDASFRELVLERLLIREPNDGRVRAVLETAPSTDPEAGPSPIVRLSLLDPLGQPTLVAEVDSQGDPRLHIGHPDRGITVVISNRAIDAWAGGNIVASMRSEEGEGRIELADARGATVVELPKAADSAG